MDETRKPRIGRIVHFFPNQTAAKKEAEPLLTNGAEVAPAMIIQVEEGKLTCHLHAYQMDPAEPGYTKHPVLQLFFVPHFLDVPTDEDGNVLPDQYYWDWPRIH